MLTGHRPKILQHETNLDLMPRSSLRTILIIGAACQFIYIIDRMATLGISFDSVLSLGDISDIRQSQFEKIGSILGPLAFPIYTGSSLCFLGMAIFAYGIGAKRIRWGSLTSLFALLCIALVSFFFLFIVGARGPLLFVAFILVCGHSLGARQVGRPPLSKKFWIGIVAAVIPLSMVSVSFQLIRDGGTREPFSIIRVVHNAIPADWLVDLAANDRFTAFYLVQLGYLTSSLNLYEVFSALGDNFPGPFYGMYNFTAIARTVFQPLGGYVPFTEIREDLFMPLISIGQQGNVWTTQIRDLVADFSYSGAVIFLFVFGFLVQWCQDSLAYRPTGPKAALLTLLRLTCIWSYFHSLFFIEYHFWAIVLSCLLMMAFPYSKRRASKGIRARRIVEGQPTISAVG